MKCLLTKLAKIQNGSQGLYMMNMNLLVIGWLNISGLSGFTLTYAGKEGEEEFEVQTVSAWEFPKEYLKKLLEIILAIDDSATVECTYQDEIPKFVGAFYGTKNGNDYKQEVPDEDDFEDDEGDIVDVVYDEAVENYEYELDDLCQKLLDELKK